MTPEQIIKVLQAHIEGKPLRFRPIGHNEKWKVCNSLIPDFRTYEFEVILTFEEEALNLARMVIDWWNEVKDMHVINNYGRPDFIPKAYALTVMKEDN